MAKKKIEKADKPARKGFPAIQFLLLVLGIVWLVEPYIIESTTLVITPIIVIVVAITWLINFYKKR